MPCLEVVEDNSPSENRYTFESCGGYSWTTKLTTMNKKYILSVLPEYEGKGHIYSTSDTDIKRARDFERFCIKKMQFIGKSDFKLYNVRNLIRQFKKAFPGKRLEKLTGL